MDSHYSENAAVCTGFFLLYWLHALELVFASVLLPLDLLFVNACHRVVLGAFRHHALHLVRLLRL